MCIRDSFKIFQVQVLAVFLFQARPADRTGRPELISRTCTLVHVCRPTARVDRLSAGLLSGFLGRPPGRPPSETCVSFRGRLTRPVDPSPTATASRADGRPDRSTARPAKPQRLFPLLCISEICFCNLFWQIFSELLEIFSRSNKLKINCF